MTSILLPCSHVGEIFLKLWIQVLTLSFMEFLAKDFVTHFMKNLHSYLAKKSNPTKCRWILSRRPRLMPPPFKPQLILHLLPKSLLPSHNHSGRFVWRTWTSFWKPIAYNIMNTLLQYTVLFLLRSTLPF